MKMKMKKFDWKTLLVCCAFIIVLVYRVDMRLAARIEKLEQNLKGATNCCCRGVVPESWQR